jgi:hypothetical protein
MFFSKLFMDSYGVEHLVEMNHHTMHSPYVFIHVCFTFFTSVTFKEPLMVVTYQSLHLQQNYFAMFQGVVDAKFWDYDFKWQQETMIRHCLKKLKLVKRQ